MRVERVLVRMHGFSVSGESASGGGFSESGEIASGNGFNVSEESSENDYGGSGWQDAVFLLV